MKKRPTAMKVLRKKTVEKDKNAEKVKFAIETLKWIVEFNGDSELVERTAKTAIQKLKK